MYVFTLMELWHQTWSKALLLAVGARPFLLILDLRPGNNKVQVEVCLVCSDWYGHYTKQQILTEINEAHQ